MSDKPESDDPITATKTLSNDDIVTERGLERRSMLQTIGVTVMGAAATALGGCIVPAASGSVVYPTTTVRPVNVATGLTDGDPSDPAGNGRGNSGVTDSDGGPYADPAGRGRGGRRSAYTGLTDSDGGAYADPGGYGRGVYGRVVVQPGGYVQPGYVVPARSGISDSDPQDPGGNGRGGYRYNNGYTGLTDSDPTDGAGHGRSGRK